MPHLGPLVGDDQQQVARYGVERGDEGRLLGVRQELGDRGGQHAAGLDLHPHQALGPPALGLVGEVVELVAPEVGRPAPGTRMPLTHGAWKALNSVAAKTSVSSTSSRPKRTSGLSDPKRSCASCQVMRPISARRFAGDRLGRGHDGLGDEGEHLLLAHEAGLEVELHELELPVGAQVLVSQAAGDLVVAVDAPDHGRAA